MRYNIINYSTFTFMITLFLIFNFTTDTLSEEINWKVFSNGGTSGANSEYILNGTVGQTIIGNGTTATSNIYHGFWQYFKEMCCVGKTGDVNCSGHPDDEEPDISDIVRLIDYLYLSKAPLCCHGEADANGSCDFEPDISDIVRIIDYLYLETHTPVAYCDDC